MPIFLKGFPMEEVINIIRVANRVQDALISLRKHRYVELLNPLVTTADKIREIASESKRLTISLTHGWFHATDCCCNSINRLLDDISYNISRTKQLIDKPSEEIPSLSTIIEELKQLKQEFGGMEFDKAEDAISVETGPITLEDVYLGPFRIRLELKKLAELYKGNPYYCIALDPHPATTNEEVTHPHVSNDILCEGEGSAAISSALEQGRLCDFFLMVKGILNNYSPDSPYVSLDEWDGEPCYECGYIMNSENSYYCSFCDHGFCEECTTCCLCCDETVCAGCMQRCSYCEEAVCPNCMTRCIECGSYCCKSCIENDVCPNCKEELENENEDQRNQINTNSGNPNTDNPKPDNSPIKLAS
jgi:hypothetical protein